MVTTGPPLEVLNDVLGRIDDAREELEDLLKRGAGTSDVEDVYKELTECADSISGIRPALLDYSLKALERAYAPPTARPEKTAQDLVDMAMAGVSTEDFMARFRQGRSSKELPANFSAALETIVDGDEIGGNETREGEPYKIKDVIDCGVFTPQLLADYINKNSGVLRVNYKSDKLGLLKPKGEWTLTLNSGAAAAEPPAG